MEGSGLRSNPGRAPDEDKEEDRSENRQRASCSGAEAAVPTRGGAVSGR